ncbi:DUF1036 domain-containing protein [Chelativorans salis]|uniref:DUF1036 domain-containing protein n=1 Tax=Chelativorans salis TaxID=2978478 RepID=A0ABT2LI24_9HYPH|nr:DUF1036 domain-containing protein [Chelativorans sp. EGI FJ00035]MCT7374160.1 DUF1036 domain-containing protein [Chelativorans sp. EGI FJ00035]
MEHRHPPRFCRSTESRSATLARLAPVALAVALLAVLWPERARAEFTVCNQTLDVVNLAVGQEVDSAFQTNGWWTVGANQCVNVIREELANRYIYIYATDVFGQPILNGSTEMCVERRRFTIRGIEDCWQRGHIATRYYEVDTLEQVRWTLFLTESGP